MFLRAFLLLFLMGHWENNTDTNAFPTNSFVSSFHFDYILECFAHFGVVDSMFESTVPTTYVLNPLPRLFEHALCCWKTSLQNSRLLGGC